MSTKMNEDIIFTTEDVNKNKVFGVLAYLGILVLVPLLGAKDSLYARFHANQGLILLIFNILLTAARRILTFALKVATFGLMNDAINIIASTATGVITLVFIIIGIVNACSGEARRLPIIGGFTLVK